ncbi:MAG: hypothetical protein JXB13_21050 [Phycisphaerae bacterium]|nr:hypothetical protein [Phycisphaerae bacterium]
MREQPLVSDPLRIEDDVWVGAGCSVLPGVTIGRGAVLGARAVATKDIPPYAVAAGVPARVLRYRMGRESSPGAPHEEGGTALGPSSFPEADERLG